jgi:hypothetical protein
MVPDAIKDQWSGPAWRWWALGGGLLLAVLTSAVAGAIAAITDGDARSLTLLGLLAELCIAGAVGSGMFEGLTARAIAGGMARQPLPERRKADRTLSDADRLRRDRLTLRAGLIALPLLAVFFGLLLS